MTPEPSIWPVVGVVSFPDVCTCQSRDDWRGREGVREGEREMIKKSIRVLVDKAP